MPARGYARGEHMHNVWPTAANDRVGAVGMRGLYRTRAAPTRWVGTEIVPTCSHLVGVLRGLSQRLAG